MIIVKIGDGMGNQLFNYACGYAAARRENDTLKLDTSEADNSTLRDFELDKFHLKYDERESFPNRTVFQKIYKRLRRDLKYRVIKERDLHAVDQRVFQKKRFRNKYLHGYWQHTGYFEPYLKEITDMMTPAYGQSELVKKLCAEFQTTDTCAVHVRGGDIVGPGRAFFERALARMEKERPGLRYLVFTNDKEAAKEALDKAGKARMQPFSVLLLECPYPMFERIKLLIEGHEGRIESSDYGAAVTLTFLLPVQKTADFSAALTELSGGQMSAEEVEQRFLPGARE